MFGIARITPHGKVTEFRKGLTPNIHPWGITAGPDGNLWFTQHTTPLDSVQKSIVGRITPSGVITEFSAGLSPKAGPFGITQGPDGNLWFADSGNKPGYGSITTSGKYSHLHERTDDDVVPLRHRARPAWNALVHRVVSQQSREDRFLAEERVRCGPIWSRSDQRLTR